ncbi:MAG: glycosyltransferase family 2 protein [Patescibacteria group bacterium]
MNIFVVIPAYYEEKRIKNVVEDLYAHGYSNIVVVDDGSKDATSQKALIAGAHVLRHVINRDQGAALETGTQYALRNGADIIVHFDADGQMQASDIKAMIQPIADGDFEVTLGSRYLRSTKELPFLKRYFIHPVGRVVNVLFTGLWLTDAHCGFRALSRNAAETIHITQDGKAHASEILEKIKLNKLTFTEVPVDILYHEFGQGLSGGIRIVFDLIKAKLVK